MPAQLSYFQGIYPLYSRGFICQE